MKFSRIAFRLLNAFEKWYYGLSYGIRHVVGIMLLVAFFGGIVAVGYGGYRAACVGVRYASDLWHGRIHIFSADDSDSPEYSQQGSKHFDFKVPEDKQHPKRRPNFSKDFDYINDVHLAAAQKLGIKPAQTREELEKRKGKLVELRDTRYYSVLPLTSSSPYLVPRAADFLTALGKLMQQYNGTTSRFLISSVLRTQADVSHLGRFNTNASKNSTHCYGTTFDITYSRFDLHGKTTEGQLKEDLARALYDMQQMGYCYVKYEVRQPCFHVTVRP